jgi:hypothetical protein
MTPAAKLVATNEVLIISSNSVRGDEPTLEFSRDDLDDDSGERDDDAGDDEPTRS